MLLLRTPPARVRFPARSGRDAGSGDAGGRLADPVQAGDRRAAPGSLREPADRLDLRAHATGAELAAGGVAAQLGDRHLLERPLRAACRSRPSRDRRRWRRRAGRRRAPRPGRPPSGPCRSQPGRRSASDPQRERRAHASAPRRRPPRRPRTRRRAAPRPPARRGPPAVRATRPPGATRARRGRSQVWPCSISACASAGAGSGRSAWSGCAKPGSSASTSVRVTSAAIRAVHAGQRERLVERVEQQGPEGPLGLGAAPVQRNGRDDGGGDLVLDEQVADLRAVAVGHDELVLDGQVPRARRRRHGRRPPGPRGSHRHQGR